MVQACSSASGLHEADTTGFSLTMHQCLVMFYHTIATDVWCCFTTLRISAILILYAKKTMMKWSGHYFRGLNTVHDITFKSDLQGPCAVWKHTIVT